MLQICGHVIAPGRRVQRGHPRALRLSSSFLSGKMARSMAVTGAVLLAGSEQELENGLSPPW